VNVVTLKRNTSRVYTQIQTNTEKYIEKHTEKQTQTHTHIQTQIHTNTNTHKHKYTQTHKHTNAHSPLFVRRKENNINRSFNFQLNLVKSDNIHFYIKPEKLYLSTYKPKNDLKM
jgi:hypothetical protein